MGMRRVMGLDRMSKEKVNKLLHYREREPKAFLIHKGIQF